MPLGLGPVQLGRRPQESQPRAVHPQPPGPSASPRQAGWHPCCSHCSVTRPWVGHGRGEQNMLWAAVHLPGGRVCRQAASGVLGWAAGHRRGPHSASSHSDPRPSASQCLPTPSFQHRCLSQSFMGSGGPEFRSRFLPLVSCVVLDKSLLLSKLPFPYL